MHKGSGVYRCTITRESIQNLHRIVEGLRPRWGNSFNHEGKERGSIHTMDILGRIRDGGVPPVCEVCQHTSVNLENLHSVIFATACKLQPLSALSPLSVPPAAVLPGQPSDTKRVTLAATKTEKS